MNVYIDFDRTLFDCERFLEDFYDLIDKYEIPKNIFKKCQTQCRKNGFNPTIILDKVSKSYVFNEQIYDDYDKLLKNTYKYLYSDTLGFLDYLKSHKYNIIILTKGNILYQEKKIMNSKIDTYYTDLIVTMKHKGNLNIDYKNSVFLDDNPIEIESILTKKPKNIIRIRRDNSKYFDLELKDILTVSTLDEIIERTLL